MPFMLSFVSFVNAGIWTAYSLIYKLDLYVLVSVFFSFLIVNSDFIIIIYIYMVFVTLCTDKQWSWNDLVCISANCLLHVPQRYSQG